MTLSPLIFVRGWARKISLYKRVVSVVLAAFLALTVLLPACTAPSQPAPPVSPVVEAPKPSPASPAQPITPPVPPATSATGQAPTIVSSSAQANFPASLSFKLTAWDSDNITDIRLRYDIDAESFAPVVSEAAVDFTPAPTADVQWTLDMKKTGGLPTGAGIDYWWIVKDSAGNSVESPHSRVSFDDQRYKWLTLAENKVTIYWYSGNQTFAEDLMSSAQQAMTRLAASTGAALKKPVKIYLYANQQDLLGAMVFPQEWTGGAAYTEFGIISLGIGPSNIDWGRTAIAHELTHLVVHQMTFNPYNDLPTWLDEGLAMYNQGPLDPTFIESLNQGISNNALISVRSLSSPFSAFANQSYLSYAQSDTIIDFLVATYGQPKMLDLLTAFSKGSSYDAALQGVYGFDMDGLNTLWKAWVTKRRQDTQKKVSAALSIPDAFTVIDSVELTAVTAAGSPA